MYFNLLLSLPPFLPSSYPPLNSFPPSLPPSLPPTRGRCQCPGSYGQEPLGLEMNDSPHSLPLSLPPSLPQTRGGCQCAGPYAQELLGLGMEEARLYEGALLEKLEILRPGFTRFRYVGMSSLPPSLPPSLPRGCTKALYSRSWRFSARGLHVSGM